MSDEKPHQFEWTPPSKTPGWMRDRNCKSVHPDVFFPPDGDGGWWDPRPALEICAGCRVRRECLDEFLGERHGVFGGTTPRERREIRRQRRRAA